MSGFTTPAHEGFNWFRSAIPPGANDRLVNVAPGQATDVYAGVAEQVIRMSKKLSLKRGGGC